MKHPTEQDKTLVKEYLSKYLSADKTVSLVQYERLSQWLNGYTLQEIAQSEGVTHQAVQLSVSVLFNKVKRFGNEHHRES